MKYVGGKSKLAGKISEEILSRTTDRGVYLEPFMGGGAVFVKMAPNFQRAIGADLHPDLIHMWDGLYSGSWTPPDSVTEEEYRALKTSPPSADRAFAGFGCSFGAKFFGGYARKGRGINDPTYYAGQSKRNLEKSLAILQTVPQVFFRNTSYDVWNPKEGQVVYCDPPYYGTLGYSTGKFDHIQFWMTMDRWVAQGAKVFVSEYTAPKHWTKILEIDRPQTISLDANRPRALDRLYTREI